MEPLKVGFNSSDFPVALTCNTSPNDVCASFFFKWHSTYYLLWVEHQNSALRENENSPRYAISHAINEGDDHSPEIYSDTSKADVLHTNSLDELIAFFE